MTLSDDFVGAASAALTDEPPEPPRAYTITSASGQWRARLEVSPALTTVARDGAEVWRIEGWHARTALSDRGLLIVLPPAGALIPPRMPPTAPLIRVFRDGKEIATHRLGDVIDHPLDLPRTVSHRRWGTLAGFDDAGRFRFSTVEGRHFALDADSGALSANADN